ncbi:MAG: glutamate-1-semialdehyde 2,1-aminomutase [Elusimicrobia bacterium]|nr:glutamate-1-semialdehyde 2,1-aminomutase [Elusimicrobiota bacterium]
MKPPNKSQELFKRAQEVLVGGVNSPVRSFAGVGETPRFITKAKGALMWDADDNRYLDLVQSWGAIICGHSDPRINRAVNRALPKGTSYGACHEGEIILAEIIRQAFPKTAERVRLMNSGTEAAMTALRLARAAAGRDLIVKFAGGYHGHHDSLLVRAGSGVLTLGQPGSLGVPESWASSTLVLPYNDLAEAERIFAQIGSQIAGVIVEPIACNMGVVKAKPGFLETLRKLTREYGSVLIFDEVITGFRLRWGGFSDTHDADLVCLGKIIGGGFPVGAVAGKKHLMELLAPIGGAYHAGTLSGNPIAVAAGIAALRAIQNKKPFIALNNLAQIITKALKASAKKAGIAVTINQAGGLWTLFFTEGPVNNYDDAQKTNTERYARFFKENLKRGIYYPPSNFEACFLGMAHTKAHAKTIINAAQAAFKKL